MVADHADGAAFLAMGHILPAHDDGALAFDAVVASLDGGHGTAGSADCRPLGAFPTVHVGVIGVWHDAMDLARLTGLNNTFAALQKSIVG